VSEEAEAPKRGFLIMPFKPDLEWIRDEVVAAGLDEGVEIDRADNIFDRGVVLDQIFRAIDEADVIVAVCTGRNPNVFFEMGYAWRNHNPILIADDTNDLPFDIQHYRTELYGRTGADQHRLTLRPRVRKAIKAVLVEERLPRGQRLARPPTRKQAARLSAQLIGGSNNNRLVISNTGTADMHEVNIEVPEDATSFSLFATDMPIEVLRPGEQVKLLASQHMGPGRRIFDIKLTGKTAAGENLEFPVKISL
jgi:hypothetical protein